MSKEELPDIRKSIEKLEKDEEERIKRMRELISQLDINEKAILDSLRKNSKT